MERIEFSWLNFQVKREPEILHKWGGNVKPVAMSAGAVSAGAGRGPGEEIELPEPVSEVDVAEAE
jgi:hypothetical protein